MLDRDGVELHTGDYVKAYKRWIDGKYATRIAILGHINHKSAIVLFSNGHMPVPFPSKARSLRKLEIHEVEATERIKLLLAKKIYDEMMCDLASA